MEILNRPAIKAEARRFINYDNNWAKVFFARFMISLIISAASFVLFPLLIIGVSENGDDPFFEIIFYTFYSIIALFVGPLFVAVYNYLLRILRYNDSRFSNIFTDAKNSYWKFFALAVLKYLFIFLGYLLIIPGIIMSIAFCMAEFIINDNPNLSAMDAIKISCRMTKGFKWKIFVMFLSFILWFLLIYISAGLASLYVQPYIDITLTMYYENLKKNAIDNGIVTLEEFGIYKIEEVQF